MQHIRTKKTRTRSICFGDTSRKNINIVETPYFFEHITVVCYCSTTSLDNVGVNAPNHLSYHLHCSNLCVFNA